MNLPPDPGTVNFSNGAFVHRHDYDELHRIAEVALHELECRVLWIAEMNSILGYDNTDGFHSEPCPFTLARAAVEHAKIGAAWYQDSSLEKWFPFSAEELTKLKELNEDKFKTIQAYCKMASLDKWKIKTLTEAIDRYISAAGYSEHTKILTEARADVVNAKPTEEP